MKTNVLRTPSWSRRALLLLAMLLTLTACATRPPTPPASGLSDSLIPPLAKTSRQPAPPSECVPTCSDGLMRERASWPALPTPATRPASSASGTTTR